jgi:hypothetical protein
MTGIFSTPRPLPDTKWPVLAGAAVVLLALPIAALVDAPLAGWAVGAALWAVGAAVALFLGRLPLGADNLAASGMRGVGMTFRGIAIMVVLIALTVSDEALGVTAALTYIAAYTTELALSLVSYFGGRKLA